MRFTIASTLLASGLLISTVSAAAIQPRAPSSITIKNKCASPVHLAEVCGKDSAESTIAPGATHTLQYPPVIGGLGACSVKVNFNNDETNVLQYEYSIADAGPFWWNGKLWWNMSVQDGNPFRSQGSGVTTSGGNAGAEGCPRKIACPPGQDSACSYQGRNPFGPTWLCSPVTNLEFYLC